jgi:hypothetical protein
MSKADELFAESSPARTPSSAPNVFSEVRERILPDCGFPRLTTLNLKVGVKDIASAFLRWSSTAPTVALGLTSPPAPLLVNVLGHGSPIWDSTSKASALAFESWPLVIRIRLGLVAPLHRRG